MQEVVQSPVMLDGPVFVARRHSSAALYAGGEPRQFAESVDTYRPEVTELAEAIDQYKLRHRRRFLTFEELHDVITELGYSK